MSDEQVIPSNGIALNHSGSLSNLCTALAQAEAEFPEIVKDTENPFYRSSYADLATLIKATRPILSKHGLCIVQSPTAREGWAKVTTMLLHKSGEWMANELELPASKQDAQGLGSAITYARRYSYQSILNIAGEEDDDGNAAVGKSQEDRKSRATENGAGKINPVQLRAFNSACKTGKKTEKQIAEFMQTLGRQQPEELEKHELDNAIKWAIKIVPTPDDDLEMALAESVRVAQAAGIPLEWDGKKVSK